MATSSKNFLVILFIVLTLGSFKVWTGKAAEFVSSDTDVERQQIIDVVTTYFEIRYQSLSRLKLGSFESVFVDAASWQDEMRKLEIQIYHAKRNHLRYVWAKFILTFEDIALDSSAQTATVRLLEGHDVIFEVSKSTVSSMRNLEHTISLKKLNGSWVIVDDDYNDYLWRLLKSTQMSDEEIFASIDSLQSTTQEPQPSLPQDSNDLSYDRDGAIDYAHHWYDKRNPNYYDFSDIGGDCTNFVSQAFYNGGKMPMGFPDGDLDVGTPGWYYVDVLHRAKAWTWVDSLYDFIVNDPDNISGGPEGYEVDLNSAIPGDIIQYERTGDSTWDHSVIIVSEEDIGHGEMMYWVASHDDDVDNYPYTSFAYKDVRFIHVVGAPGGFVYLPLTIKDVSTSSQRADQNPYPGPVENFEEPVPILPYPGP